MSTVCEMQKLEYLPTGSKQLDRVLRGGLRSATVTEVFGENGSGKTQFAIEMMLNAALFKNNGNVIYVSTKNNLAKDVITKRVGQYVEALNAAKVRKEVLTVEGILKKIKHKRVFKLTELIGAVYQIREMTAQASEYNPVKLIVIDSFTHFLRDQTPFERIRISYEMAAILENAAVKYNCAVLLTSDMAVNMQSTNKIAPLKPMLGDAFAHRVNQRIELQRNRSNRIISAFVWKNLEGKHGVVKFMISEKKGIIDV